MVVAVAAVATALPRAASAGSLGDRSAYWGAAWADGAHTPHSAQARGASVSSGSRRKNRALDPTPTISISKHSRGARPSGSRGRADAPRRAVDRGCRGARQPLIPVVTGAYSAFVIDAALDWDWGCRPSSCLRCSRGRPRRCVPSAGSARPHRAAGRRRFGIRRVAHCLRRRYRVDRQSHARGRNGRSSCGRVGDGGTARGDRLPWAPWSAEPPLLLGDARLAQGDLAAAREKATPKRRVEMEDSARPGRSGADRGRCDPQAGTCPTGVARPSCGLGKAGGHDRGPRPKTS